MRLIKLASANKGKSFEEKIAYVLDEVRTSNPGCLVLKLSFYLNSEDVVSFTQEKESVTKMMLAFYKDKHPALTIIPARNVEAADFVVEYEVVENLSDVAVRYKKLFGHHYVVLEVSNNIEVISGGVSFSENDYSYGLQKTFDFVEQLLDAEGMTFDHIYLQRNYHKDISLTKERFDEIKGFYFEETRYFTGAPLNTNLGLSSGNTIVEICAVRSSDDVLVQSGVGSIKQIQGFDKLALFVEDNVNDDVEKNALEILDKIRESISSLQTGAGDQGIALQDRLGLLKIFVTKQSDQNNLMSLLNSSLPDVPKIILVVDGGIDDHVMWAEGYVKLS